MLLGVEDSDKEAEAGVENDQLKENDGGQEEGVSRARTTVLCRDFASKKQTIRHTRYLKKATGRLYWCQKSGKSDRTRN